MPTVYSRDTPKTGELKPKEKPKKKRKKSWTQRNPDWKRLKNLSQAEWEQEKKERAKQEKKRQAEDSVEAAPLGEVGRVP